MTSVCQVKTERLQSHDALISQEFSSLASYTDDDSGNEKTLAPENRNDVKKQFVDGVKNDPESSEFFIENILGISSKKQAAIARARAPADKNNRSKWPPRASKPEDKKLVPNNRKVETSFPEESLLQCGLEASLQSSVKTGHELTQIRDDRSVGEFCKKQKMENILKTMNGKNQKILYFDQDQDSDKDKINKDEKLEGCLEQENTKQDQLINEQLLANSAWVSAINNYYGNLSPSWKMWQDLVFRRPLPTGTVHRQHPVFHPYIRRAQELGGIGGLNFPPFPLKLDFSKSKSFFPSTPQALSPNQFQRTEEVLPRPNSSIETDPSACVKDQADLNSFSGSSSPHGPLERDQNSPNFNSNLLRQSKPFIEIDSATSKSRNEMGIHSSGKKSKFFNLENGPFSQNSTAPSSPRCPSGEEYSSNEPTTTGANVREPSEGRSMNSFSEPRKKKTRTVFSRNQIFRLETTFEMKRYLSSSERASLAANLHLTETQIKIWFQNRRNKWKRQTTSPSNEALCLGMGQGVVSISPFNAIPHATAVGAQPQRRPPFLNPLSYNLSATGCRPTGQCPPMGPYNFSGHRALFPWGSSVAKNDFYKLPPSAFQYYSQNMYAAMVASANTDKRRSPDDLRIAGLDLSMPSLVQINSEKEGDKTILPTTSTSILKRMNSENCQEITSKLSNNADNPS